MDFNSLKTIVDNNDILSVFPELCILLSMAFSLFISLSEKHSKNAWIVNTPLITLGLSFCILLFPQLESTESIYSFKGTYLTDSFSLLLKGLILLILLCLNFGTATFLENKDITSKGEFQFLILGASLGASFLVSTNDLVLLFIALETLSLSSIALVAYVKKDSLSGEAGIKYLLNGAIASACLIFAISLFYGIALGNTTFSAFPNMLLGKNGVLFNSVFPYIIFSLGMSLVVAAIAFKLSLAPFHLWSPDVYNGAALPSTAFLATVSKIAAFGIFCRLGWTLFASSADSFGIWCNIFALLAIASMFIGNFVGARQVFRSRGGSLKRLFAYSSVAQIGYIITGVVIGTDWTAGQSMFYLMMYVIVNLGAFLSLIKVENWFHKNDIKEINSDSLDAIKGLFKVKPKTTIFLTLCVGNLAAVFPSMLIAKLVLLDASIHASLKSIFPEGLVKAFNLGASNFAVTPQVSLTMAFMILFSSVIAIFYYVALIKKMFVDDPHSEVYEKAKLEKKGTTFSLSSTAINFACLVLFFSSIALSVYPEFWIGKVANPAAQSLLSSGKNDLITVLNESVARNKEQ
ncbi:MAG: NADH-quinone oxidoreductase subunit N [Candidatus Caenarcaniphilales bacterium]|nr:NADH-quinone oxidoreductase subunit N [Candidatus Caenarcaniphilales bacterium]